MIRFFRQIRQGLLTDNKFGKYLLYAVGEIILVVIGILVALSINNWNDEKKQRATEIHYLKNLKTDLQLNIAELNRYIGIRNSRIESATKVLEHYEGKPLRNLKDFMENAVRVYGWQRFTQQDNTFQELINSGNLALISNDSIKNGLLDLQSLYNKLKNVELHVRFDSETMLYEPSYSELDLNAWFNIGLFSDSIGPSYNNRSLLKADIESVLKDRKQKNGFAMTRMQFINMNWRFNTMKAQCNKIIGMIDRELADEKE